MDKPIVHPWPRLMREKTAAAYIDRSPSWMRNTRYDDRERMARGQLPRGPEFIKQGKDVRYPKEYLDEWADQFKQGTVPGWEAVESNITGLKHQKKSGARVDAAHSDLAEIKDNGGQSHDRIP